MKNNEAVAYQKANIQLEEEGFVEITEDEYETTMARILAEAEAEANNKIKASLSDDIIRSKFYDKWDGKLPEAMGSDSIITSIN